jgi:hypothetical protein
MNQLAQKRLEKAAHKRLAEVQEFARRMTEAQDAEVRAEAMSVAKLAFDRYWLAAIESAMADGQSSVNNKHMRMRVGGTKIMPRTDQPYIDALREILGDCFFFTVREERRFFGLVRRRYLEISWVSY